MRVTIDQAIEALDNLDDYSQMACSVDPIGAREVLERFIAEVNAESVAHTEASTLTELKTKDILSNGQHKITGYVLHDDYGNACLSAQGAVRWLDRSEYWRLMHEQDGSLFATLLPRLDLTDEQILDAPVAPAELSPERIIEITEDYIDGISMGVRIKLARAILAAQAAL